MNSDAVLRIATIGNLKIMSVIDRLYANLCLGLWGVEGIGTLPDISAVSAVISDITGISSEAVCRHLSVNQETFLVNGWDANKIIAGTNIREAGADAAPAPTISAGAGTLTGSYTAVYTYYDSARDYETSPVATAPTVVALTAQGLNVVVTASANSRFDKIRVYRNANGVPGTFLLDTTVTNANQTVLLTQADSALGAQASYTNYRPPVCKYVAKTATRIFWGGARPFTSGTATVTNGSTTVTLSTVPPQELYTRNAEAPFYFQVVGEPRYGITAISGATLTLSTAYKGTTASGQSYVITALPTRVYYADITSTGLVKSESWNPSNKFDLGLAGDSLGRNIQEEITGMFEYGNRIYVWLREAIWYFDPLLSQRKRTAAQTGTPSDKTIQPDRNNNLLYLGTDMQVYAFNGAATQCISDEVSNLFAKQNRYNMNLMEYAFARYDDKEKLYELYRPAYGATLPAMKYIVDVYDDLKGEWMDKITPRLCAVTKIRDSTRQLTIGVDTLGLMHQVDDYENSVVFNADVFAAFTPTVLTSAAGEISPGTNKKGKMAVVFTSTTVKGTKLIVGSQSSSAQVEDLFDAVTVAAGDSYMIGAWHSKYETGWIDHNDPDTFKTMYFIEATLIKNSAGYFYISWYIDESTTKAGTIRVDIRTERKFKRGLMARYKQIKFVFEFVTELGGFSIRDMTLHIKRMGGSI